MFSHLDKLWYQKHPLRWLLWPLSMVYRGIVHARRWYYQLFADKPLKIPVVVVGNLSVGGVGKTPLVIAIAKKLVGQGLKVGIVSRGYGARISRFPHLITAQDTAEQVGDEPLLIARKTDCPVVIAPKRNEAVSYLEANEDCDVILSDDGLQHYSMRRAVEIIVIDGTRGLGNGLCLPAGPLREPSSRLKSADYLVVNEGHWPDAYPMHLKPMPLVHIKTGEKYNIEQFSEPVAAIAGIGNPQRFFFTLKQLGVRFSTYPFPDHYRFKPDDFKFTESSIVMTEKDAVKCHHFAGDNMYYLPVEAELSEDFWHAFTSRISIPGQR
ncbi:tetraacyldisaccharide 4'-kinase [Legionella israelensis]|uniref:Tetraacyldisaccharide 4'-kinase n=1 Tax=Legionella israelensis TaxID=454 RepID=A0A0W0V834_9GAMM|nr:tetraacyldisaccharide 4'-kinase [Legionella israelensis]KTD16029.1 tetraacyldisaccharide 4'-kinase [Legionella israelensis]QBS08829.1 tetraacyldisaccharide 4'-kinase [Legionella israelensis]SCY05356.1 lipid-A-disaccharide kinase [Legionella israelensis DSM 19235]STX58511.1 tetraacyldisaccharide 4'-kinase [Legionella israelensis]